MNILALDLATLQRLYVEERKTTREIGALYGVNHRSVIRLMRQHGVEARPCGQRRTTLDERFTAKFLVSEAGCWEWIAAKSYDGYGQFNAVRSRAHSAHRWSYRRFKGEIPDGYEVDHLCRNRACVNPDHLEAVTKKTNTLRGASFAAVNASKAHCPKGHPLVQGSGQRVCRICRRASALAYYDRLKGAA